MAPIGIKFRSDDFNLTTYPTELEIKDTTDTNGSASYLDTPIEIECEGRLRTKLYDKKDDFNFPIVNQRNKSARRAQLVPISNADCLLKNTSTKHNKYVVNQKLEHVEDISFR
jgi:hypothetical protein